jgi:acetolactate synthase-1/2/3 large subunit
MAREQLDITVVIFNNRSYAILNIELERVGASGAGPKAKSQLDLAGPNLDFVQVGNGLGVPSLRVQTCEQLGDALRRASAEPGPHLVEVVIPSAFSGWKLKAMPRALRTLRVLPRPLARAVKRRLAP